MTRINVPIQKLKLKTHGEKVSNLYQVERLVKRLQENGEPLTESLIQLLLYYDYLRKAGVHFLQEYPTTWVKASGSFGLLLMPT